MKKCALDKIETLYFVPSAFAYYRWSERLVVGDLEPNVERQKVNQRIVPDTIGFEKRSIYAWAHWFISSCRTKSTDRCNWRLSDSVSEYHLSELNTKAILSAVCLNFLQSNHQGNVTTTSFQSSQRSLKLKQMSRSTHKQINAHFLLYTVTNLAFRCCRF